MSQAGKVGEVEVRERNVSGASATNMTFTQTSVLPFWADARPKIFTRTSVFRCESASEQLGQLGGRSPISTVSHFKGLPLLLLIKNVEEVWADISIAEGGKKKKDAVGRLRGI